MNQLHLAMMANQIGSFFLSYPDQEEARAEIATHIQRFWAPRMRSQLLEHVALTGGHGLDPLPVLPRRGVQRAGLGVVAGPVRRDELRRPFQ